MGGEQGQELRRERQGKSGGEGRNRTSNGERGGRRKRVGQRGLETKRRPLVEDVLEYQESYEGEGAD